MPLLVRVPTNVYVLMPATVSVGVITQLSALHVIEPATMQLAANVTVGTMVASAAAKASANGVKPGEQC